MVPVKTDSAVRAAPNGTVSMELKAAAMKPKPKTQRPALPMVWRMRSARFSTEKESSTLERRLNHCKLGCSENVLRDNCVA